jgi:hypothetical protein
MKKTLKRLAGAFNTLKRRLLDPVLPRPAYQHVPVPIDQPRVSRVPRRW